MTAAASAFVLFTIVVVVVMLPTAAAAAADGDGDKVVQAQVQASDGSSHTLETTTRYVSISMNQRPEYLFYAPIVARGWSRLGFKPVVSVVTSPSLKQQKQGLVDLVSEYATKWGGATVKRHAQPEHVSSVLASQLLRLFASACIDHTATNDDTVMVSDVDMLVLKEEVFQPRNVTNPIHYWGFFPSYTVSGRTQRPIINDPDPWNDEGVKDKKTMLQMCFPEATVWGWRLALHNTTQQQQQEDESGGEALVGCDDLGVQLSKHVANNQEEVLALGWGYDQHLLTRVLGQARSELRLSGLDVDLHPQNPRSAKFPQMDGRLRAWDEQAYPSASTNFNQYGTAHLPKPGHLQEKWDVTVRLIEQVFGKKDAVVAEEYRQQFMKLLS